MRVPTRVRFLSCEPLLGPVDLRPWLGELDWIIAGGESGPHYRVMDMDWLRSIRDQCQAAGVALFHKQSSGPRPGMHPMLDGRLWREFPAAALEGSHA